MNRNKSSKNIQQKEIHENNQNENKESNQQKESKETKQFKVKLENVYLRNVIFYLPDLYEIKKFEQVSKSCQIAMISIYRNPYKLSKTIPIVKLVELFPKLQTINFDNPTVKTLKKDLSLVENIEVNNIESLKGVDLYSKAYFANKVVSIRVNSNNVSKILLKQKEYCQLRNVILENSVSHVHVSQFFTFLLKTIVIYRLNEIETEKIIPIILQKNKEYTEKYMTLPQITIVIENVIDETIMDELAKSIPINVKFVIYGKEKWNNPKRDIYCFPVKDYITFTVIDPFKRKPLNPNFIKYQPNPYQIVDEMTKRIFTDNLSNVKINFEGEKRERPLNLSSLVNLKTLFLNSCLTDITLPKDLQTLFIERCQCKIDFNSSQLLKFRCTICECEGCIDVSIISEFYVTDDKNKFTFIKKGKDYKNVFPFHFGMKIFALPVPWFQQRRVVIEDKDVELYHPTGVTVRVENYWISFDGIGKKQIPLIMDKIDFYKLRLKNMTNIKSCKFGNIYGKLITDKMFKFPIECKFVHYIEKKSLLPKITYTETDNSNIDTLYY